MTSHKSGSQLKSVAHVFVNVKAISVHCCLQGSQLSSLCPSGKVKVNLSCNRPWWHRLTVEVLFYSFFNLGARWGGWLTPRSCRFTSGNDAEPIVWEAGLPSGLVWTGAENLVLTGIRSPDRPARSESPSGKSSMYLKISMQHWWNDTDRGKQECWRKTCRSATLYTTKPTRTELGLNPVLRNNDSIFSIQCSPISKRALFFGRFPGFDPLSFRLRADKCPVLMSPHRPNRTPKRITRSVRLPSYRYTSIRHSDMQLLRHCLGRHSNRQCHRRFTQSVTDCSFFSGILMTFWPS